MLLATDPGDGSLLSPTVGSDDQTDKEGSGCWAIVQYSCRGLFLYNRRMDVAVTDLRANLSEYLSRVRAGHEVLITERGIPVARLSALDATTTLERLVIEGQIARPSVARRPIAAGRKRPQSAMSVSDLVSQLR